MQHNVMCFSIPGVSGAYAEDWSRWKGLLYSLYDALIREISQIGSRGKYVTGSRPVAVKDGLIELSAHICQQVKPQQRRSAAVRRYRADRLPSVHLAVQRQR